MFIVRVLRDQKGRFTVDVCTQCLCIELDLFSPTRVEVSSVVYYTAIRCHCTITVPRPSHPVFVACSTGMGGRPGKIHHVQ